MDRIKSLASVFPLEVGVDCNEKITINFIRGYVSDYPFLIGKHGVGSTVEEAAEDYYRQIQGKKIVIDSPNNRREFYVV